MAHLDRPSSPTSPSRARDARASLDARYEKHAGPALRLAILLCGDRELAQDLVQDAFVKVEGRMKPIRDPASFDAHLRQAVVDRVRSQLRRRPTVPRRLAREGDASSRADRGDLAALETTDALHAAFPLLSERQREALVCRFSLGLNERQAAELLDCPPATVASLVARGLANLQTLLAAPDSRDVVP